MSVIIRLQNLPLTASSLDIRNFFHGLSIPDGGVHIVGGPEGDAFIAFSTDEDARQAMRMAGSHLKESRVSLLLSSRNEMYKVIEQARVSSIPGAGGSSATSQPHQTSMSTSANNHHFNSLTGNSSPSQTHLSSQVSSSSSGINNNRHQSSNNSVSSSMSPTSSGHTANDYLRSLTGAAGANQADLSANPALLFSTIAAIPSATLGASPNAFLNQHHQQQQQQNLQAFNPLASMAGSAAAPSHQQQQNQGFGGGNISNSLPNPNVPPPSAVFPNGNPFLIPPPNLSNLPLPLQGLLQGANDPNNANNNANSANNAGNLAAAAVGGLPPVSTGVLSLASSFLNNSMSIAGQHGQSPLNPFGNNINNMSGAPPPRMGMLNNNGNLAGAHPGRTVPGIGIGGNNNNGLRFGSDIRGMNSHGNTNSNMFGAGVGANVGGGANNNRLQHNFPPRFPFGNHQQGGQGPHHQQQQQDTNNSQFQFGAIPSGRSDMMGSGGRDNNNRRAHSPPKDRRFGGGGGGGAGGPPDNRRRRSRSRDRDHRRRRSRSRSKSRSRSRDRSSIGNKTTFRRDSRDKRDTERKSRSDSSPEKNRRHEPSPPPTSQNTTTDEWPGAKLTGIPNDASYREIKEFIRVDVMGGSDGVVRLYEEGVAFLKLKNPSEFPRVFRSTGRKLRGSNVSIEGITMETWTQEYKLNKSRIERDDIDREREEREKERDNRSRDSDRNKDHGRDRERHQHHHQQGHTTNSPSTTTSGHHQRSSRFSNATHQSSCIAIRGLAPTVTRQELITRYLHDTPCLDIVLIAAPTPTNRHSVTAFIQFDSPQIAQTVIDGIVRSPLSTTLVVESCELEHLQMAKLKTTGSGNGQAKLGLSMNSAGGDAKSIFELDLGLDDETTTIIMKGAPPNITERDVFDFFSDIGLTPMNVRIMYDNDGQCSGQVICEFPDNNKAKRATTKDGMLFGRGQISVSLLPSRSKKTVGGADFTGAGQLQALQASFAQQRNRPGLLGPSPHRGGGQGGGGGGMTRFSNPPSSSSPNIFEQALQQQSGPPTRTIGGGEGARGRGSFRGRGERMSRFSNSNDRSDFRNSNGIGIGRGRGAGGSNNSNSSNNSTSGEMNVENDDMALFNKKGCVIGLENVPYKSSMDDILQYLEETLKIQIAPDRIIRRYDEMQKPTGDARVAFDTAFEAKLACDRLRGTFMWKRQINAAVID